MDLVIDVDEALPEQVALDWGTGGHTIRDAHFDEARRPYFHYSLFVHDLAPSDSTSGVCCSNSRKDFLVSLGEWANQVGTVRDQSGILIHELGHAIGLGHGGGDGVNYKPNYLSVMNYRWQTSGLTDTATGIAQIDYSRAELPRLVETALNEPAGIGDGTLQTIWLTLNRLRLASPGNLPLDWTGNDFDGNGIRNDDVGVTVDINGDGVCVTPGQDNVLQTTAAGDDVVIGTSIFDGPDRTCDSTAAGGAASVADTQEREVGNVQVAELNGYNDWANIKYRAAMSPDAGYTPPPTGPELDYPTAVRIQQELIQAANTTDLAVSMSSSPNPAGAGAPLTFTINVSNLGPNSAKEVQLVDVLPAGLIYQSDDSGCTQAPVGTVTCNLGEIQANDTKQVEITVLVQADLVYNNGGPLTLVNAVSVNNNTWPDLDTNNNQVSENISVVAIADLEIVSSAFVNPPSQMMVG